MDAGERGNEVDNGYLVSMSDGSIVVLDKQPNEKPCQSPTKRRGVDTGT